MLKRCIVSFMVMVSSPLLAQAGFLDVPEDSPLHPATEYMQQQGIIVDTKTKFFPEKTISRGELLELAWRAAGYRPTNEENSRFAPYIRKSNETGIFKKSQKFRPNEKITRIEGLKTIFDIMGIGVTRVYRKNEILFKDLRNNSQYAPLGKTALEFSIMREEEFFRPKEKLTRALAAEFIYRIDSQLQSEVPRLQIIQLDVPSATSTFTQNEKFKILDDVWNRIHEKFVFQDRVDDEKLIQGAIQGMVSKLGDKYSVYQEPSTAKTFNESLTGEFEGIGVSIDSIEGKIRVVSPIKGAPASKAGLKANDIIVEVDKKTTKDLTIAEVSALIKGKQGTDVELLIERSGKKMTFKVTRERIKLDAVTGEMDGNVAIITIRNFTETSGIMFGTVVRDLLKKKPASFVIDVRDNPGGYLTASLEMLDHFLPAKTRLASLLFASRKTAEDFMKGSPDLAVRGILDDNNPEIVFHSKGEAELSLYPIDILINGGSASASEILAASLKENNKARLIGEESFGKGTVQEMTDYTDGSLYKHTIGKWQTPLEHNLTDNPIKPDIILKDNPKTEKDETLEYAIKN